MICLDNSVLRRFASPDPSPAVDDYLANRAAEPWVIPATVAFEYYLFYETQAEIRTQQRELTTHFDGILPLDNAVAVEAARLHVLLDAQDVSLGFADLLHAATAREAGATFVTRDRDFDARPLEELMTIDIIE